MRLIKYITEEYLSRYYNTEFFVNPTLSELASISKDRPVQVRFFIDFTKKNLIVWDMNILHKRALRNKDMQSLLGVSDEDSYFEKVPELFSGFGVVLTGKIDRVGSDSLETYQRYERYYKEVDATWTSRWFKEPLNKTILKLI